MQIGANLSNKQPSDSGSELLGLTNERINISFPRRDLPGGGVSVSRSAVRRGRRRHHGQRGAVGRLLAQAPHHLLQHRHEQRRVVLREQPLRDLGARARPVLHVYLAMPR